MIERGHILAGWGLIHWFHGPSVSIVVYARLYEEEVKISGHMNDDHTSVLARYTCDFLGIES